MHIFNNHTPEQFENLALEIFRFQAREVEAYQSFLKALCIDPEGVKHYADIPHIPVELFKTNRIIRSGLQESLVFESSGTTGMDKSRHYVADKEIYRSSSLEGFRLFYGEPSGYCILALLPSYLERPGSSLVFMVRNLMNESGHPHQGFYLNEHEDLQKKLLMLKEKGQKTLLIGVSFALLEFAKILRIKFTDLIIMETGGMKGRGREMLRQELHERLCKAFGVKEVHSEYGMTELLSQAYSKGNGLFKTPPWMKIQIRDIYDPFSPVPIGTTGRIVITDLANIHSCSFIATSDIGKLHPDGSFEVLGRIDHSDTRGCNLMIL